MKQFSLSHQQVHSILITKKFIFIDRMNGIEVDLYQDDIDGTAYLQNCDECQEILCTADEYVQATGTLNINDNFIELIVILPYTTIELQVVKSASESDFNDIIDY